MHSQMWANKTTKCICPQYINSISYLKKVFGVIVRLITVADYFCCWSLSFFNFFSVNLYNLYQFLGKILNSLYSLNRAIPTSSKKGHYKLADQNIFQNVSTFLKIFMSSPVVLFQKIT